MQIIIISLLLGTCSAFFGAITNVLAKKVVGFAGTRDYISINFITIFLLILPLAPFLFMLDRSLLGIFLVVLAALMDGIANYLYFRAFEITDTVIASSLLSLSPLFTLAVLPLIDPQNTALNLFSITGILAIVAGVIILNLEPWQPAARRTPGNFNSRKIIFPLLSSLIFGVNIYLIKYIFTQNFTNPYTYYLLRALIIASASFFLFKPGLSWVNWKNIRTIAGRAIAVIGKWMLLLYAIDFGNPPIIKTLSETSSLFVIPLAVIFLKEKIDRRKIGGALLTLIGLLLIALRPG